ncbi:pleckstrin homology (PH) domain-containing protein [Wolffia australiana]
MASNGTRTRLEDSESSLEKIKRQLASSSGRNFLQGPLYKRSETLRKWNERWMILDPTTGKMEYKVRRSDAAIKGTIIFDAESTILVSPVNFQGIPKYDGCCFYIGTPQKKEYFLCAETPAAANAWVSTLRAAQLVLKAHKEAVNSLGGNSSSKLGTVATAVAAANATSVEASKQIEAAMKISMRAALGKLAAKPSDDQLDDLSIMKETLRVKDEELQHLSRELRARDSTIKELADKLTDTAEAAEAAASAALTMDEARRLACTEIERLTAETEKQSLAFSSKLKESEEKMRNLGKELETLLKQRDSALQEAHLWRSELGKAREHAVILEAAVLRAEERARVAEAKDLAAAKEKEELVSFLAVLQSQIQRQEESTTKQVVGKSSEPGPGSMTKHIDRSEVDMDKACLSSDPRSAGDLTGQDPRVRVNSHVSASDDGEWGELQSENPRMDDVKEISAEGEEGSSLDIPVVVPQVSGPLIGGPSFQP